jgi:hypothetical protein
MAIGSTDGVPAMNVPGTSTFCMYLYASFFRPLHARDSRARPSSRSCCSEWAMKLFLGEIEASSQCWLAFPGLGSPPEGEYLMRMARRDSRESAHPIPTLLPICSPTRLQSCFSPPSRRCIVVISAASQCGPIELLPLYFNIIRPCPLCTFGSACLTVSGRLL